MTLNKAAELFLWFRWEVLRSFRLGLFVTWRCSFLHKWEDITEVNLLLSQTSSGMLRLHYAGWFGCLKNCWIQLFHKRCSQPKQHICGIAILSEWSYALFCCFCLFPPRYDWVSYFLMKLYITRLSTDIQHDQRLLAWLPSRTRVSLSMQTSQGCSHW